MVTNQGRAETRETACLPPPLQEAQAQQEAQARDLQEVMALFPAGLREAAATAAVTEAVTAAVRAVAEAMGAAEAMAVAAAVAPAAAEEDKVKS